MQNSNKELISNFSLIPVILSGGSGSRLWPLSRSSLPKQYLRLEEKNNFSLLQNTYLRVKELKNITNPIIISNEEQRFIVAEQMREINVSPESIILEPFGKNTAPAIALAAIKALENFKNPILLVLSSDHKIEDEKKFHKVIKEGLSYAKNESLITFGIVPKRAETGYGYIESYTELSELENISKIKNFIEKPNIDLAKKLIKDKHFLWNSGIFLFKASTILKELETFHPKIVKICRDSIERGSNDLDFFRICGETFKHCTNIPIDVAVMEKTKLGSVLSLNAGWDDIGSWESLWKNSEKDKDGNITKGEIFIEKSKNCYLRSEERLIVGIDLENLIVIETNDAVLVSKKESTQKVKQIVQHLNKSNPDVSQENKKKYRPWGNFTTIEKGANWQVKKLEVKPNASISLQMHHKRSEHWVIVNGTAKVEIDGEISLLNKNESAYIPLGAKHRLSNPGEIPLILIEVQSGNYLGEDDIIRFEDVYGRTTK